MMLQGQSYHRLYYHLAFGTKYREHFIATPRDGDVLRGFIEVKARQLDSYVEEFGCWYEHVHMLLRAPPKLPLSKLYGQLKGFSSYAWTERFPDRPFKWQDGVYIATVEPPGDRVIRAYIREQWARHETGLLFESWEPFGDRNDSFVCF